MRCPFSPQCSIIRPAPSSWSGFLKTLPNVRLFVGCVVLSLGPASSATVSLISAPARTTSRNSTRATTCPGTSAEWRYESSSSVVGAASERRPRRRRAPARESPSSRCRRRRRSSARRRPRCRGSRRRTRSPPSPAARARWRQTAFGAPPPATSTVPAHLDRRELALEPDDERVDPGVGREQVRAEPDRPHVSPRSAAHASACFELGERAAAGRARGRARRSRPSSSARAGRPPRSSRGLSRQVRFGTPVGAPHLPVPWREPNRARNARVGDGNAPMVPRRLGRRGAASRPPQLRQDRARGSIDVSRADREREVSGPRPPDEKADAVVESRSSSPARTRAWRRTTRRRRASR